MLNSTNAIATISVKDLEAAKKFYAEKLGLKPISAAHEEMSQLLHGKSAPFYNNKNTNCNS